MNVQHSLNYFEEWKSQSDHISESDSFLPMITYNNLQITVYGFLAYTGLVLHSHLAEMDATVVMFYVPALHSNQSCLEAWFLLFI